MLKMNEIEVRELKANGVLNPNYFETLASSVLTAKAIDSKNWSDSWVRDDTTRRMYWGKWRLFFLTHHDSIQTALHSKFFIGEWIEAIDEYHDYSQQGEITDLLSRAASSGQAITLLARKPYGAAYFGADLEFEWNAGDDFISIPGTKLPLKYILALAARKPKTQRFRKLSEEQLFRACCNDLEVLKLHDRDYFDGSMPSFVYRGSLSSNASEAEEISRRVADRVSEYFSSQE